jgi:hypothetical protein
VAFLLEMKMSVFMWLVTLAVGVLFLLPSMIAFLRGHRQKWAILALNLLSITTFFMWYGITIAAWGSCLVWACLSQNQGKHNGAVNC